MRRVLSIFAIVSMAACSRSTAADAKPQATTPAAATQAAPATPANPTQAAAPAAPPVKPVAAQLPPIVARVNGEDIKSAELENAVKELGPYVP